MLFLILACDSHNIDPRDRVSERNLFGREEEEEDTSTNFYGVYIAV